MKRSIPIGHLREDARFQTILTGRAGIVVNDGDPGSIEVHINGLGRRRLHPDILVYIHAEDGAVGALEKSDWL